MLVVRVVFWLSAALLVWTQLGYALALAALARLRRAALAAQPRAAADPQRRSRSSIARARQQLPAVSLIVAAHDEQEVIAAKVANALALDYPRERLRGDRGLRRLQRRRPPSAPARPAPTSCSSCRAAARSAPRTRPSTRARGELLAFSDANALVGGGRAARAGRRVRRPARSATPAARSASSRPPRRGADQPGGRCTGATSWRCAQLESRLSLDHGRQRRASTRPAATATSSWTRSWATTSRSRSTWSSAGWRAVYVPSARASEKMVPSLEGEFARKRRMMSHTWPILLRGGMLSPRGYAPRYALMIISPPAAALRARPRLHVIALGANVALVALGAGVAVRGHARAPARAAGGRARWPGRCALRALLIARYYVLTTASLRRRAVGLAAPRHARVGWEAAEGHAE